MKYDIAIIGGGPAGYTAAITAGMGGAKTVLFEKQHLGGICLHYGCVPTKAILKSAAIYRGFKKAETMGIKAENVEFDLSVVIGRAKDIIDKLNKGVEYLLDRAGITVIKAEAEITSPGSVSAAGENFECGSIIIATGARSRKIPNVLADGDKIVNYKEALFFKSVPENMIVIGSGAIGMEFAEIYSSFGSKITLIEKEQRILPGEEKDVSDLMKRILTKRGYRILTGTEIASVVAKDGKAVVGLHDGRDLIGDKVLVAAGITGNIENIGLEKVGVVAANGHIITDQNFTTNVKGIYAVGDVADHPPYLAHKAMHEAKNCAKMLLGKEYLPVDSCFVPSCVYTSPQIASFGIKNGQNGKRFLMTNAKALCDGEPDGFIKTYVDNGNNIVGASMIGDGVAEIIGSYLAMNAKSAAEIIMPHPSLSESITSSIEDIVPV